MKSQEQVSAKRTCAEVRYTKKFKKIATKMMFKVIGNHDMVSEKILNL